MKKLYILFLLTALPFMGFAQTTIATYTFDSDVEGWVPGNDATVTHNATNYYTSTGALELNLTATNKVAKKTNIDITETGEYTVSFKIKSGDIAAKTKAIINQGSNVSGDVYTITSLVSSLGADGTTWYEYSHTFTITSLVDVQIQIQGSHVDTYYIDDVTFVKEPCAGYAVLATNDGGGTNAITTVLPCYPTSTTVEFTATPSCGDFTFSEWEIDGTPSGISTNPYTYTVGTADAEIKALFTASATAPDTNFDTDAELSNWIGTTSTTVVSGDNLIWTITGGTPKIAYNACAFAPTTWVINKLKIQYTNGTDNTRLRLVHPKNGGSTYINYDDLAIAGDATGGVGTIDVALNHATWLDFLSNIEFLLRNDNANADATGGDFTIDFIEFYTDATAGIDDVNFKDDANITLYPNPVQNELKINAPNTVTKMEVFNILGQKVLSKESSNTLNVQSLSKGAYISKIYQDNDTISTKRFVKD